MTQSDTILREETAALNRNAFVKILEETSMVISPKDFESWRPTKRIRGVIPGMPVAVTCIATDGILGIFEPVYSEGHDLGPFFIGHVHRFTWVTGAGAEAAEKQGPPPPLYSASSNKTTDSKPKAPRKKPEPKVGSKAWAEKQLMDIIG